MIKKLSLLLLCFLSFCFPVFCLESKFLLLLGPSGVGKSTIIQQLKEIDQRFVYVSPYTTRDLRPGETDKVHVSYEEVMKLWKEGKLLTINEIYGIFYATPKDTIDRALQIGNFPILDWPVTKMEAMQEAYKDHLYVVYIAPESIEELERRLSLDGRDKDGKRFAAGVKELECYHKGDYDSDIHLHILNECGNDGEVARQIYDCFLRNLLENEKTRS